MGRNVVFRAVVYALVSAGISITALTGQASAYTPTLSSSGAQVHWFGGHPKLVLAGNPTNSSGIGAQDFRDAVVRGLQRWKAASGGALDFDYYQGADPSTYIPNSEYNGLSSIYFASNAKGDTHLDPNVLGLTQVWYNTDTGEILEADIVLNDQAYQFTTDPHDTTGYGTGSNGGFSLARKTYIDNVITHELGHAFGLSHSGGLQSTMLFMESPEQDHLGCDEQVGIHAIYPTGDAGQRAAITGSVVSSSGAPVFGAHVEAISRRRGTPLASAMTDKSGHYTIAALEPGSYVLMAEPFFAGAQALPSFYSAVNPDVCQGEPFSRTVLTGATGAVTLVNAGAGGTASAPPISVRCASNGGAAIVGSVANATLSGAEAVFDGTSGQGGFAVADRFDYSSSLYYKMTAVGGHLEVHAVAYSLYSPIHATLSLLDSQGNAVYAQIADSVYTGDSGFVNYDSALVADNLADGDYYVKVDSKPLNASVYPAGPVSLDTVPFMILTGSVNEPAPAMADVLAQNARCRMDENFAQYVSPPGNPPRKSTQQQQNSGGGVGFCSTIASEIGRGGGGGGSGPSSGPGAGAIAGWLLPWFLMFMPQIVRRTARRLEARSLLA